MESRLPIGGALLVMKPPPVDPLQTNQFRLPVPMGWLNELESPPGALRGDMDLGLDFRNRG